ncbi:hypothetical protein KY389_09945 [Paracoccus bogoriensis]|uniref:hypothetical protein n=1 Tax=Paracoccus bogoriensis TaxID=242065 RepID=UPI001CA5CC79|nr:hypothetical protein [Paracoccus bogoriensis]MBW7057011.1 hypothetical protein [Paracoccus bogoriensis]
MDTPSLRLSESNATPHPTKFNIGLDIPLGGRSCRPNDTVEVMGQRMEMGLAATLGLIARNPDGSFSFSGDAGSDRESAAEATQQAPEGQPEGDTFRASDDAEGALTALVESLPPGTQMAALNALVETGQVGPEMIERMARQSGAEPADLARQIEAAHAGFYDSVMDRVEAMGVHDSDLFGDFIEGDPKLSREMQQAVRNLMMTNDATGFDRLAERFVQSLDRVDPQAVKEALTASGIPHRRSPGGELVLTFEGHGEVSYQEAVKQGLIRVSRA